VNTNRNSTYRWK